MSESKMGENNGGRKASLQDLYDITKSAQGAKLKITFDPADDTTLEERRAVSELVFRCGRTTGDYLAMRQRLTQLREDLRRHSDSDLANEVESTINSILEGESND